MFNFFDEIKKRINDTNFTSEFNIINMSGKIAYVEGHLGLLTINPQMISFKIKNGRVVIEGDDLMLCELTENTILIKGKVKKVEIF